MTATLEATPAAHERDIGVTAASPGATRQVTNWPALDGVRGLAVLAVVVWHVFRLTATGFDSRTMPFYLWPMGTTRLAVDAFFVLSGFLVIRSWRSLRARSTSTFQAYWTFARRRAARILPAYWLSLAVFVPLFSAFLFEQPRRLALFVTLNQYVRFWLPGRVNVVYWSLTVEWHFYLLVPLLTWLLVKFRASIVLGACVFLSVMWWAHVPPLQLPNGFVFGHLDQFVVGAIAADIATGRGGRVSAFIRRIARHRAYVVAFVVALLAIGTYHGSSIGQGRRTLIDALVHPTMGFVVAALLVAIVTGERKPVLEHPVLLWFGMISFSLYIWHYPILARGLAWADVDTGVPDAVWRPIAIALVLAFTVAVATLSYTLVERPFLRGRKPPNTARRAGTLTPWPSRRSSASKPSTASCCVARPIPTRSSRRRY